MYDVESQLDYEASAALLTLADKLCWDYEEDEEEE